MKEQATVTDEKKASLLQQLQLRLETARTKFSLPPTTLVVSKIDNLGHVAGFYVQSHMQPRVELGLTATVIKETAKDVENLASSLKDLASRHEDIDAETLLAGISSECRRLSIIRRKLQDVIEASHRRMLANKDAQAPSGYVDIADYGKSSKDVIRTTTAIIVKAEDVGDLIGEYTINV